MAEPTRLDQKLLKKIADNKNKPITYIRQQISKRANRLNIAPEAAQLIWAKKLGFSISSVLRQLEPHIQDQVRSILNATINVSQLKNIPVTVSEHQPNAHQQDSILAATYLLISDEELLSRCSDLLRRKKHLDRVMREATVVLENRIRQLAGITTPLKPEDLVNTAINPDPAKAILIFGTNPYEQQGFHSICRGIVLTFRHNAHHRLTDDISRQEALKFCGFIDILLQLLATTTKRSTTI